MITDKQVKKIQQLSGQGKKISEIAKQVNVDVKTVKKYAGIEKTPALTSTVVPIPEVNTGDNTLTTPDYNINNDILSSSKYNISDNKDKDNEKARHFCIIVYPSEKWIREHVPDCVYDGSSGWGEAPDDWIEQLQNTGLAFVVSPLHDKDINPDETKKKPHWHVIVSWANTTTFRSARALAQNILHSPLPIMLKSVDGMYRYLTHADNPEKYQYKEMPRCYNGWTGPLDNNARLELKMQIRKMLYLHNCTEYGELVAICSQHGSEYFDVVSSNTLFFSRLCTSFRYQPCRVLAMILPEYEGEDSEEIIRLLQMYQKEEERKKEEKIRRRYYYEDED